MTLVVIAVNAGVIAAGLREVLSAGGCQLTSVSSDALIAALKERSADVVVLERDEPGPDAAAVSRSHPGVTVVVVSVDDGNLAVFPAHHDGESYSTPLTEDHLVAAALRP